MAGVNVSAGKSVDKHITLDRADYLQTGANPERDRCEHKYISDLKGCKKPNNDRQGEKSKDL